MNRWKESFDRLRCWLIKKLGGYAEIPPLVERRIEWREDVKPQYLHAQISVYPPEPEREVDFKQFCAEQVIYRLMREIYQSGFILWEREDDIFTQKVNIRATLCVVNANDLKPYFKNGVE